MSEIPSNHPEQAKLWTDVQTRLWYYSACGLNNEVSVAAFKYDTFNQNFVINVYIKITLKGFVEVPFGGFVFVHRTSTFQEKLTFPS